MLNNRLIIILIVIAGLGFIDASYLAVEHFLGSIPPCSVSSGCESVLTSKYSEIMGVPVALIGAVYYAFVLLLLFIYKDTKKNEFLFIATGLVGAGFLATLGFVYLQLFVIKAICLYCMGSAISTTLLFLILIFAVWKYLRQI